MITPHLIDSLIPFLVLGAIGATFYQIIKLITDYTLKKKMIEKGFVDNESQGIFKKEMQDAGRYSSLKWGLVVFFGGLALVLLEFIRYSQDSTLPFGILALFISGGFLLYFFLIKDKKEE